MWQESGIGPHCSDFDPITKRVRSHGTRVKYGDNIYCKPLRIYPIASAKQIASGFLLTALSYPALRAVESTALVRGYKTHRPCWGFLLRADA